MNICLLAFLLLQSSLLLPPRGSAVNPAAVSQVPAKLQKDYDKLWSRFVSGQGDAQLMKDIANFMKKQKNFDPVLTIDAYIELKWEEIFKFEHTPHPIEYEMYYSV